MHRYVASYAHGVHTLAFAAAVVSGWVLLGSEQCGRTRRLSTSLGSSQRRTRLLACTRSARYVRTYVRLHECTFARLRDGARARERGADSAQAVNNGSYGKIVLKRRLGESTGGRIALKFARKHRSGAPCERELRVCTYVRVDLYGLVYVCLRTHLRLEAQALSIQV